MKYLLLTVAAAAGALSSPATAASLLGETVGVAYHFPDTATVYGSASASPAVFVIGAGPESTVNVEGVTFIDIDFGAGSLDLVFNTVLNSPTWNSLPFNGLIFTGPGLSAITGWTVAGTTTFGSGAFDAADISRVGSELRLNWAGITYNDGEVVNIRFDTSGGVPELATWSMMVAGFGFAGMALRWRRRLPA